MQLVNDIVPKMFLSFLTEKTIFDKNNGKVTVIFDLENQGKYGSTVDEPITSLSKGRYTKTGEFEVLKELVEG